MSSSRTATMGLAILRPACSAARRRADIVSCRTMLSSSKPSSTPLGALLYVPSSSTRFLESSLKTADLPSPALSTPNTIIYDLEDSIHPSSAKKTEARTRLSEFLQDAFDKTMFQGGKNRHRIAVRPNALADEKANRDLWSEQHDSSTDVIDGERDVGMSNGKETKLEDQWGYKDLAEIWGDSSESEGSKGKLGWRWTGSGGPMMLLPKVDHPAMLTQIDRLFTEMHKEHPHPKTQVIASIESPEALLNVGHIASWRGRALELVGLTFAAEDYCASTHILRSPSRTELLHARSTIVVAARTFGLSAIDMVCVDYKDGKALKEEAEEGRRLGFDGKQAIHPSQVETIRTAFAPSPKEIRRAASILAKMNNSERGAETVADLDGKAEMIDRPMVLQAQRIVREAKAAGLTIPDV